jgi:hypothetical protein
MPRARKNAPPLEDTRFFRQDSVILPNGFEISKGEIFRVATEYGVRFKFQSFVTNKETGAQWVDCFEMFRGTVGQWRSFRLEEIKRIPVRSKRARRIKDN